MHNAVTTMEGFKSRTLRLLVSALCLILAAWSLRDVRPAAASSTSVSASGFGALNGALDSGAILTAAMNGAQTSITVSDHRPFKVGMKIKIDNEQMLITGVHTEPLTETHTIDVSRFSPSSHAVSAPIWANWMPIDVQTSSIPATRAAGSLMAGLSSATTQNSGSKLFAGASADVNQTVLRVTDAKLISPGSTITIDGEQMYVAVVTNSVGDGFTGDIEAQLGSNGVDLRSVPESAIFPDTCLDTVGDPAVPVDNDGDGLANGSDPGCATADADSDTFPNVVETALGSNPNSASSTPESAILPETCFDVVASVPQDNDGDGLANGSDVGCDSVDADGDGFIGAIEVKFGPASPSNENTIPETSLFPFTCSDTVDNDGDGQIDAADAGCATADTDSDSFPNAVETALGSNPANSTRTPEHAALSNSCEDGIDNDGDTLKDAEDSGCNALDVDADELQVSRNANGTPLQSHLVGATIVENVIDAAVSDQALLTTGSTLQIDSEQMLVKFVQDGTPDVVGVVRGMNSTSPAEHSSSAALVDLDGLGSYLEQIQFDTNVVEAVSANDGPFLTSTGRGTICNDQYGSFVDTGATLSGNITDVATTFGISDQRGLRVGALIQVDAEQMLVTGLTDGSPDTVTVLRPQGSTHTIGTSILGQNAGGGTAGYSCVTSAPSPFGPTGSGKLATFRVIPLSLQNAASPVTVTSSMLLDTTGDAYAHVLQNGSLRIVRCPDPTLDGVADFFDFVDVAKAAFGLIPAVPSLHDTNADGVTDFFDFTDTAKLVFLSPSVLKCLQ